MSGRATLPELRQVPDLPRTAWLYHRDPGGASILAGSGVETFATGIFEGCWSGEFSQAAFAEADNVFGTGLSVTGESVRFVTPSHVQDGLFAWLGGDTVSVSNSLAFLLEFRGVGLPFADWGRRFFALAEGIDADYRRLHQTSDGQLLRVAHDNFEVRDGAIRTFRPSPGPAFQDFAAYREYLREQLRLALANGRDPSRRRPLRAVATVSSGYDSTAAMALAVEFGLDAAVTLEKDRHGADDSGSKVAEDLGIRPVVRVFRQGSSPPNAEAEFIATGSGGEDLQFGVFAEDLADAMLINGFYGDAVWDPRSHPSTVLRKLERTGNSLGEFCLRVGATSIPVPMIGARRHPDIRRISLSAEMAPWRIGGPYDRPVARRIAEEAGVRREVFGQRKRATSQHVFRSRAFLSPASWEDFRAREAGFIGPGRFRYHVSRLVHECRWNAYRASFLLFNNRLRTAWLRKYAARLFLGEHGRFEHSHPRYCDALFLWALDHQRRAYSRALGGETAPAPKPAGTDMDHA